MRFGKGCMRMMNKGMFDKLCYLEEEINKNLGGIVYGF